MNSQPHPPALLDLYRVDLGQEWTITRLAQVQDQNNGVRAALEDAVTRLQPRLRKTGGEHFLDALQEALDFGDLERGWQLLRVQDEHFGLRYVLQAAE